MLTLRLSGALPAADGLYRDVTADLLRAVQAAVCGRKKVISVSFCVQEVCANGTHRFPSAGGVSVAAGQVCKAPGTLCNGMRSLPLLIVPRCLATAGDFHVFGEMPGDAGEGDFFRKRNPPPRTPPQRNRMG